jgi:hypothetical protein
MPNKPIHLATSGSAGLVFAYMNAPAEGTGFDRFLETTGGSLGGALGGLLPDVFDPPCHPHHRSLAHGVLPVVAGAGVWVGGLAGWQVSLRNQADAFALKRLNSVDPLMAALYGFVEMALRVLCGAVAGFGAGYLTHVALDFTTPCGLPLIN